MATVGHVLFTSSLPELYERFLVEPLFRPFAQELLDEVVAFQPVAAHQCRELGLGQRFRIGADEVRNNLGNVVAQIVQRCLERTPPPHFVRSPSPPNGGEDDS